MLVASFSISGVLSTVFSVEAKLPSGIDAVVLSCGVIISAIAMNPMIIKS